MDEFSEKIKSLGEVTFVLIVINVLVFIWVFISGGIDDGEFMLAHGAMNAGLVQQGQWYRLFTACFLHFDGPHLFNNMLMLGVVGQYVERHIGNIKMGLLYLLSGVGGNLVSMWFELMTGKEYISAGASGAVFGIVGGLLALAVKNRGRIDGLSLNRILFMIALSLYAGFSGSGVNNAAHVGGLLIGFVFTLVVKKKHLTP